MERLNDILPPHIGASKIRLSYAEELFPDLRNNPYIVLHKKIPNVQLANEESKEESFDEYSARHDVVGSPLRYSFSTCELDDTIVNERHNWRNEEESYLPLNRTDMCNALNICLEYLDNNNLPILALCDGKDPKQTRILGSIVCKDWFTTLEAVFIGVTIPATIKTAECHKIVKEHLQRSLAQEQDVKISVFNTFNLFGVKQENIDWNKITRNNFEGNISIETYSNSLMLDTRLSKNILIVEINAGWKDSPLKELRSQLLLLMQYLSIIDTCQRNIELQNPIKFATSFLEEDDVLIDKLNLLLNGNLSFRKPDFTKADCVNEENIEIDDKLLGRVQNVVLRHNIDFTDLLWEILIHASDYSQMVSYIRIILKGILEHKFIPEVNDTNTTRFVKCISDLHRQGTISHLLVGSVPLEFVVDIGFEKLVRDYLYILRKARFIDVYDVRQKLVEVSSGLFNTEDYRKRLVTLTQIHISLEYMLLIEAHLECPTESLQSLFANAYKKFVSKQSPLQHYTEFCNQIYTLTAPVPNATANELNKMNPTVWRASLTSHSAASNLTTTTYHSKMPIFPINIYSTDDVNAQEEVIYGLSATSSSIKYKKL